MNKKSKKITVKKSNSVLAAAKLRAKKLTAKNALKKPISKKVAPVADVDNPAWTKGNFAEAKGFNGLPVEMKRGLKAISTRGRPRIDNPKEQITLRLNSAVVAQWL